MSSGVVNVGPENAVYTGFWVNWSQGQIRGATLTLTNRNAGFLTAFLALFVSLAGRAFWRLCCFAIHLKLSTDISRDGLHHQRQAILRNATTDVTGLQGFLHLAWNWRNRTTRPVFRLLPVITLTALITATFYAASILSSQISRSSENEVLLSQANCGVMIQPGPVIDWLRDFNPYLSTTVTSASAYAQQCYSNTTLSQVCGLYDQKELPIKIDRNISCPFPGKEKICLRESSMNLRLDTGLLDSHTHFGINARPEDRFQYRRVTECAVLRTENYTLLNASAPSFSPRNVSLELMYGGQNDPPNDNLTYWTLVSAPVLQGNSADYTLDVETYDPVDYQYTSFIAIPELRLDNAVTSLIFLTARDLKFVMPVDDDWYSAHRKGPPGSVKDGDEQYAAYFSDQLVNVLGCTEKRQVCNPVTARCSPLSVEPLSMTWSSDEQAKSFNFWWAAPWLSATEVPKYLGANSLKAAANLYQGLQGPLPSDQWQQEVLSWESTALAHIQRMIVEAVTGPSDISVRPYVSKNVSGIGDFCIDQKIRSTAYTCFSVLGLVITLVLGGLIIILSEIVQPLCIFLDRRKRYAYQRLEWISNETLQLQRMVHEELGLGTWSKATSKVPVTENDERLGILDISNPEHPMTVRVASRHDNEKPNGGSPDKNSVHSSQSNRNDSSDQKTENVANSDPSPGIELLSSVCANPRSHPCPASVEGQSVSASDHVPSPRNALHVRQSAYGEEEQMSSPTSAILDGGNSPSDNPRATLPSCPPPEDRPEKANKAPFSGADDGRAS